MSRKGVDPKRVGRSARDSNPQALSGARFRGECNTILPALPNSSARRQRVTARPTLCGSRQVAWDSRFARSSRGFTLDRFAPTNLTARLEPPVLIRALYQNSRCFTAVPNRGARIRTGDLCDPNAALYRTEPRPGTNSGQSMYGRVELTSLRSVISRKCLPGHLPTHFCRSTRTYLVIFCEDHVGSNPIIILASCFQRREWDSNPRGVATNALAGRRHKPLGHPSKRRQEPPVIAPLGIEPRLSGTRIRRVANYTTGQ